MPPPLTYAGAHRRVYRRRGRAAAHACACGRPAKHWSYDHSDPASLTDRRGRPYSLDPDHYFPTCVSCHKFADYEPAPCGTERGYWRHRREGTPRCQPCKTAHTDAERLRIMRRIEGGQSHLVQGR
jgi:hypothetical protein